MNRPARAKARLNENNLRYARAAMSNHPRGTGYRTRTPPKEFRIAGKTAPAKSAGSRS
jgi:penicillin-binding protein 2